MEYDWCEVGIVLHACREFDGDDDLVPVGGHGTTVCGVRGRLSIPGMFSRMSAPRCRMCCQALGFPQGVGSPRDDDECHPMMEARLERWKDWGR